MIHGNKRANGTYAVCVFVILEWQCHRYTLCAFFSLLSFISIYMVILNMMNECGQRAQLHLIHHQLNGINTPMFEWACERQQHTETNEHKSNWMWKRIGVRSNFWFCYLPKMNIYQHFDIWLFDFILPFQCKRTLQPPFFIQFMIYNERSDLREKK